MLKPIKQVRWWVGLSGMIAVLGMTMSTTPTMADNAESVQKLTRVANSLKNKGFSCRPRLSAGRPLEEGETYSNPTTLLRGHHYVIIGAGDSTVNDLDIELYDENFSPVDDDGGSDALPVVRVTPRQGGKYHIRVKMYGGYGYSNVMICSCSCSE